MVDFGATALSGMRRIGREPHELAALAFTHLHGDHIGGLPFLWIDSLFNRRRTEPLEILGPVGTQQRLTTLLEVTYGRSIAEVSLPFELSFTEIAPNEGRELAGFRVDGFPADHMDPPEQPLCLRIESPDGRKLAFSGDTAMCEGLMDASRGVDLLVAECTGLAHPVGRHCAWEDWAGVLPHLDARSVLLTHLGEHVRAAAERGELTAGGVALSFADDGRMIEL